MFAFLSTPHCFLILGSAWRPYTSSCIQAANPLALSSATCFEIKDVVVTEQAYLVPFKLLFGLTLRSVTGLLLNTGFLSVSWPWETGDLLQALWAGHLQGVMTPAVCRRPEETWFPFNSSPSKSARVSQGERYRELEHHHFRRTVPPAPFQWVRLRITKQLNMSCRSTPMRC